MITEARRVSGGCIHTAVRVEVAGVGPLFLKWNEDLPSEVFAAEADGLHALARSSSLRVPAVVAHGGGREGPSWLLLEYVPAGRPGPDFAEALGVGLAALHQPGSAAHGWPRDNFIGSLGQANEALEDWATFWRDVRLAPQLSLARSRGYFRGGDGRELDVIINRVAEAAGDAGTEGASLLHGDLWSGNVYAGPAGEPVLVDPAVYRGHREVDLAMSELFGGFPPGYLEAYSAILPISPEYRRVRRWLYQLYDLLVHVNLFGGPYVGACLRCARTVLRVL